jgi:hypothetical protein
VCKCSGYGEKDEWSGEVLGKMYYTVPISSRFYIPAFLGYKQVSPGGSKALKRQMVE